jgi:hypothetical protein
VRGASTSTAPRVASDLPAVGRPGGAFDFSDIPIFARRRAGPEVADARDAKNRPSPPARGTPKDGEKGGTRKEEKEAAPGACKGSPIAIEVRKSKAFPNSFGTSPSAALLDQTGCEITAPKAVTEISQHEELQGTLVWACGGKAKGTEKSPHTIDWSRSPQDLPSGRKLVSDGHIYGLCCMPGSTVRQAAEKSGFDITTCDWDFVETYTADTSAMAGSKLFHRCRWGFEWRQKVVGGTAKGTKTASVRYWGVDLEQTT